MTLALHGKSRRRRSWLLFAALIAVVFGVSGSLMLSREDTRADSTTIVKVADLTAPAGGGWLFYNDTNDTFDNTPGVLGDFVTGPGSAPLGLGSAQITIPALTGRTNLATYQFSGTLLSSITALSWDARTNDASAPSYLVMNVDFNGTNTWQQRLIYVPPVAQLNTWETFDAFQGGAAAWRYSGATWPNTADPAGPTGPTKTWNQILALYPTAKILVSDPHVGIRVGNPGPAETVNIDKFVWETGAGNKQTFDFEPTILCTATCYVNATTGNDLNDGTAGSPFKTVAKGVNTVNGAGGGTVNVAAGTYTQSSTMLITTPIDIVGSGNPLVQVSGGAYIFRFEAGSGGSSIDGLRIEKTDHVNQDIIYVGAPNITIQNNEIFAHYIHGSAEVSRGMVNSAAANGLLVTSNSIHDIRQPGYINGPVTGTVSNNFVAHTKGWVLEQGDLVFTNNTWGVGAEQNIFDIAILATVPLTSYTDVPAMSAANNEAFIEDQRTNPDTLSIVYVSPSGSALNTGTKESPKQTVQQAVDRVVIGGKIYVLPGTYHEDVNVNKAGVRMYGAGIDSAIISGVDQLTNPASATVYIGAANVLMDGFTITRDGNAPATWNVSGNDLNSAGVAIQGQGNTVELRNSKLTGNRTGVDVNNSDGNNIHNNIIDNNRTGLVLRNKTDNTIVKNNFITNNWTVGIVFLDASSGSNSPLQQALNSQFIENDLSGNWYGAVDDRQTGGSLPADGANLKNFAHNWWGVVNPTVNSAISNEPGYAAQIPVAYGGSAVPPAGPIDSIYGPAEQNIVFEPNLCSGTDTSPLVGFQPAVGCGDISVVAPPTANVGDTITVDIVANNAEDLYGFQASLSYTGQLSLAGVAVGPGFTPAYIGPYSSSPGVVTFAYTRQNPNSPVTGAAPVIAKVTFNVVAGGTANLTINPAGTLYSNNQGFPIGPNSITNDSITVTATGFTVTGTILLQGRTNHSGATAEFDAPAFPGNGSPAVLTDSAGAFTANTGLSAGSHTIRGRMIGYLLATKSITVNAGSNAAGTVTLVGGDANMSGTINVLDLSLIAGYFGQIAPFAPAPLANTTPDINGDNVVNILDLSLTAANYGQVGPTVWP